MYKSMVPFNINNPSDIVFESLPMQISIVITTTRMSGMAASIGVALNRRLALLKDLTFESLASKVFSVASGEHFRFHYHGLSFTNSPDELCNCKARYARFRKKD